MRLQIALDMVSMEEALGMAEKIHDIIDIVEIGTPMPLGGNYAVLP